MTAGEVLLRLERLCVEFPVRRAWWQRAGTLRAVEDVSLEISAGEALGLVGESGCGKSTLARAILELVRPSGGRVVWLGRALAPEGGRALRRLRRELSIIFQDPLASLDPRMNGGELLAEPLRVHCPELKGAARAGRVREALERVGLPADCVSRYPHELSGGQCQRLGIARALILAPRLLICDEPVSALDVSVQAQIIELLVALQRDTGMSLLFVSHNLAVVRRLCNRVVVLYLGRTMEVASSRALFSAPRHPYTRGLLEAVPIPDPARQPERLARTLGGEPPSPLAPPSGCVFRTRCPHALEICAREVPRLERDADGHEVACLRWRELG
jgi:oligopeptide transport system ATP-binding protein